MAAGAVLLAACYPGSTDVTTDEYDVALTIHDEESDFGSYQTYAMPDTVLHVEGDNTIDVSTDFDDLILEEVRSNMADLGYTEAPDPPTSGADVVLLVAVAGTSDTEWFYYDWWSYWGWWGGWDYWPYYGPGWGWGYPPGYVSSVTIEQGSILLTILDPAAPRTDVEDVPILWAGLVRGVLSGGAAESRITRGIDQAFAQSPYLRTDLASN